MLHVILPDGMSVADVHAYMVSINLKMVFGFTLKDDTDVSGRMYGLFVM
jgi:hypothetical protein